MKRIIYSSLLLAIVLLGYATKVYSQYGLVGERTFGGVRYALYNFNRQELRAEISGYNDYLPADLIIPEKIVIDEDSNIDGVYPVTGMQGNAFANCQILKTIKLGCIDLTDYAFKNCTNLTSFSWDKSTEYGMYIPLEAFLGCTNLHNVKLPDNLLGLGYSAFQGCVNLESLTLPSSITTIDRYAFAGCTKLKSTNFPSALKWVGDYAFQGCTGLTEIHIPNTLEQLEGRTFSGCTSLKEIVIEDGETPLTAGTFYSNGDPLVPFEGCSIETLFLGRQLSNRRTFDAGFKNSLTTLELGANISHIDYCEFEDFTKLVNIILPSSLQAIDFGAFKGCTSLKEFKIPASCKSIGQCAFEDCNALEKIYCEETCSLTKYDSFCFQGCNSLKEIALPTFITELGANIFNGCNSLKDVYCQVMDPTAISTYYYDMFGEFSQNCILHIPKGARQLYAKKQAWYDKFRFMKENDVNYIKNKDAIRNDKVYRLEPEAAQRGIVYAHDGTYFLDACGGSTIYRNSDITIEDSNLDQLFAIYNKDGQSYLYSIGQKKFIYDYIAIEEPYYHTGFTLNDKPGNNISLLPSSVDGEFIIALKSTEWINVNDLGCVGNWYYEDGGNRIQIAEVGDIPEDILEGIEQALDVSTKTSMPTISKQDDIFYNVAGEMNTHTQHGINIIQRSDGTTKKVLIR